jgi:4-carboxymuconolactone decarboxylase
MSSLSRCSILALLALASSARAERFAPLELTQMTPEQRRVAEAILATRKNLDGPFNPWLRSPELADRLQSVGDYVRYHSSIPRALNEFAILITARVWGSQVEWHAHYPEAVAAGESPAVLAYLAADRRPRAMSADERLVYDFGMALHRRHGQVAEPLFQAVRTRFGEQGIVDLIGLNGYYDAVAMTINAAEVSLPAGVTPPLR